MSRRPWTGSTSSRRREEAPGSFQMDTLRREVERLRADEDSQSWTLADLAGMLEGQSNFSEEEIDAALLRFVPKEFDRSAGEQ